MINPQSEVDRLKQNLIFGGYDQREAETITDHANNDIESAISTAVVGALSEATRVGTELGIEDFAKKIKAVRMGSTFSIVTDSSSDFSTAAYPMLPRLLKNAKRAKDGSLYRVIPIKKNKRLNNIFDAQREVEENRKAMMDAIKTSNEEKTSTLRNASPFSGLAAAQEYISKRNESKKQSSQPGEEVTFRTASSKQDSNVMWVQPPKDKNMSVILVDINRQLEDDIQAAVIEIVSAYQSQFLGGVR